MAVRKKARKVVKKKAKTIPNISDAKGDAANRKALWQAYKGLQKRADQAWEKFRNDVKRKAKSDILIQDQNHLLLLLGECNYMARECMRLAGAQEKKKRR